MSPLIAHCDISLLRSNRVAFGVHSTLTVHCAATLALAARRTRFVYNPGIMRTPRDLAKHLRAAADEVERLGDAVDWVDAHLRDHDIRSADEIAYICECSPDTVRRRAIEAAHAVCARLLGIEVGGATVESNGSFGGWFTVSDFSKSSPTTLTT
jgi:hypothetical protein